jgi:hypothetical protein
VKSVRWRQPRESGLASSLAPFRASSQCRISRTRRWRNSCHGEINSFSQEYTPNHTPVSTPSFHFTIPNSPTQIAVMAT